MTEHVVATEAEFAESDRVVAMVEGKEIGVFRIGGEYHAVLNWCAHQGGPCCEGTLTGTQRATFDRETAEVQLEWVREGEILSCPWHGWEYDATSGECLSDPRFSLPRYPVRVDDGEVLVELG